MAGCVLHVVGDRFDPKPLLARLSLEPYAVFDKGDSRFPHSVSYEKVHEVGGFKCDVSSVDWDLRRQADDAIAFLTRHYDDLMQLKDVSAIEHKCLDFGYVCRLGEHCWVQCDSLPLQLLRLCGELDIGIELSLYPMSNSTETYAQ